MAKLLNLVFLILMTAFCVAPPVRAQTTEFNFQGSLKDGASVASGNYDFEFALFDAVSGGAQLGSTLTRNSVAVANGIFSVSLDFGSQFPGATRFLEIRVRLTGQPSLTTLTPRQQVNSSPYSVKSLNTDTATNAAQLGGVAASQYVVTTDPRMTDSRNPLPNSASYIQNTNVQQAASNFNIAGDGTAGGTLSANAITSASQFNVGINHALSIRGLTNVFAGRLSGISNTTGGGNSFFGERSGRFNTTSGNNSFFGRSTGELNTASNNSFFGALSGSANTTGVENSFFGSIAGNSNVLGNSNSFFGFEAGRMNTAGGNSFFGANAGKANTSGLFNSFFGYNAGSSNTTGQYNSLFGYNAGAVNTGEYNTFFGSLAGLSNTTANANTFVGDEAGEDTTTGGRNTFIGRWSGNSNTIGADNTFVGFNSALLNTSGTGNTFVGLFAGSFNADGDNNTIIGTNANVPNGSSLSHATAIGADAVVSSSNTIQMGRTNGFDTLFVPGLIRVNGLGGAGATDVCRNASNQLSTCSSSLNYKTEVKTFFGGLNVVRRLRPITFNWKDGGISDVGFGAEEVAEVEPLLTTRNDKGEVEGVKYKQISTVLVNAVKEQQEQIEAQEKRLGKQEDVIRNQQAEIDALKQLLCELKPNARGCSPK